MIQQIQRRGPTLRERVPQLLSLRVNEVQTLLNMAMIKALYTQYFPAKPNFTEKDVGSQAGKVFIVTGSNTGVGYELVKMLYPSGAVIYMAGRSEERIRNAIESIISASPTPPSPATLKFLHYDLADLNTINAAANVFLKHESKLDILWHNGGVGGGKGLSTEQKIEGHIGINCVAPLLFTELLLPRIIAAAESSGSARIVWTGSAITEAKAPVGGIDFQMIESGQSKDPFVDYAGSKVGNYWLAAECAKRYAKDGIISVCQNPGNLKSEFYRHQPKMMMLFLNRILHDPKLGAYTELYSGFTPDITAENNNGSYIWPWGNLVKGHTRADINEGITNGQSAKFWDWCQETYKPYKL
jgi:NAD(P)-dependent dehydrogenase (short-subunit alcohol dehydrogenase family)